MKKRLSKKALISVCTLIAVLLVLIIWTIWGNTALMVSTVTVSSNRIPTAFNGFLIAQVSDLHNAVFGENNAELLQILSECKPNIIVVTGDLVDAEHTDIDVALDFAKEAAQIAGTYYVTGNHEGSLSQYDELKTGLESKKLLKFTLNDGTDKKRTILSGIHEYYEPEQLVGKTCVAITNLPTRMMMGIPSEGMLISAVYEYDGHEGLNLLMLDDAIPAGAKLY